MMTSSASIPFSQNIEETILGILLIDPALLNEIGDVKSNDFYVNQTKLIFEYMSELKKESKPIDIVTLTEKLQQNKKLDVVSVDYLLNLSGAVTTTRNLDFYIKELIRLSNLRKVAMLSQDIFNKIIKHEVDEPNELILECINKFNSITTNNDIEFESFADLTAKNIEKQHQIAVNGVNQELIKLGMSDIDSLIGGLKGGDLVVIGARPSVGKTAFALNLALRMGKDSKAVVPVFSMEMPKDSICYRMMSTVSKIMNSKFKDASAFKENALEVMAIADIAKKYNVYINDKCNVTVASMRSALLKFKQQHELKAIVIDYLQLMKGSRKFINKNEEVTEISRDLKIMARELNVPVIVLSQLSRDIEKRQDQKPRMSDLRDSGSVEQDADIIMFLSRNDYQNTNSDDVSYINLDILKCRDGQIGEVKLYFDKAKCWIGQITKNKDVRGAK